MDLKKKIKEELKLNINDGIELKTIINETTLKRVLKHINEHDSVIITAFRHRMIDCNEEYSESTGDVVSKRENYEKNRKLKAILLKLGYQVTHVIGSYIEGYNTDLAKEVKEDSFFTLNAKDDPDFIKNMVKLGEIFCQDSIIIIPKGGEGTYLYGTNNSSFPGYHQKAEKGKLIPDKENEFMTRVRKKPFYFADKKNETRQYEDYSRNGKLVISQLASKILKEHFSK